MFKEVTSASRKTRGFTLVEVMIVVVIIGLLAVMALPAFRKVRMNSQNARFISDLRMFRGAAENYTLAEGVFPGDGSSGVLPAGLEEYIKPSDFQVRSPLGGSWDMEFEDSGVTFAIGVVDYTVSPEQIQMIEERFDDGDTATGNLREIRTNGIYWVEAE
ncbi:type II secretion system protein [Rubellicoccus peritrichatus]|uniref:Prepilin-type N-terminal cleavage/methylation domain-containing protein n=1 Tax=Rubellicoccus peritrichatus TaxID=3080537 RepID=A0AAQ3LCT2_9BACT|nr:prepilin-type N-terminal cleavage/methylation domain-containing protein [Puniceicoccus sp. CR14]WOO39574.1 prepilin-type N-terminal cleavage/methylation domain-containing protein [Puniceicoccus sp. CR14]